MQQIERYGVIALVALLVTITAISFWDDGDRTLEAQAQPAADEHLAEGHSLAQPAALHKPTLNPKRSGRQGSSLPATAPRHSAPRRSNVAARGTTAPQKGKSSPFASLPATLVAKPEPRSLAFPDALRSGAAAPASHAAWLSGGSSKSLTAKREPTTNYDSIDERLERLGNQPKRSRRATAQEPKSTTGATTYTVEPGDTLSQIAYKTLGTSKRWREIQALNGNLDPSALAVGAKLKIPTGAAPAATRTLPSLGTSSSAPVASAGHYIVRKGDMLSKIAQERLGGASRWREIAALNPSIDPNRLQEGARLRLPDAILPQSRYASNATARSPKKKNRVR